MSYFKYLHFFLIVCIFCIDKMHLNICFLHKMECAACVNDIFKHCYIKIEVVWPFPDTSWILIYLYSSVLLKIYKDSLLADMQV